MTASQTPGTAVLELRDVSKTFGPVVALRSGSLRVEAGSIHALVGENGAGKSTLVKVVAGPDATVLLGEPFRFNKDNIADFNF